MVIALFTVSYFLLKIVRIPDNGKNITIRDFLQYFHFEENYRYTLSNGKSEKYFDLHNL